MILESMKMEIPVEAPGAGTLTQVLVEPEEQVEEEDAGVLEEAPKDKKERGGPGSKGKGRYDGEAFTRRGGARRRSGLQLCVAV